MIRKIELEEVKNIKSEGLVLHGCGGDPQEWLDGLNNLLTKEEILLEGSEFKNIQVFNLGEITCINFEMEDVKLNIGKLALWRLQTHDTFAGKWLSDFKDHHFTQEMSDIDQEEIEMTME